MTQPGPIWMNGSLVDWADAHLHVTTQTVLGGLNAYEVIPGYVDRNGATFCLFRLEEHLDRLDHSAKVMRIPSSWSRQDLKEAVLSVASVRRITGDALIRLVLYLDAGPLFSYRGGDIPAGCFAFVTEVPVGPRDGVGLKLGTTAWARLSDSSAPPRIKAGANYQNARLAQVQAQVNGYDDALIINSAGTVSELPFANFFIVREGVLLTPDVTSDILEGITRRTVLELAAELGIPVVERAIDRTEAYVADEAFVTGSARDVWPVAAIDGFEIGNARPGLITDRLRGQLARVVRGGGGHSDWLTEVRAPIATVS
jgi:branched-chain amino acid aminotransferase